MLRVTILDGFFLNLIFIAMVTAGTGIDKPTIDHSTIQRERINVLLPQIMKDQGVDMWLVFTRENAEDPILPTIGVEHIVARGAFIFSFENGEFKKIAVAASYDVSAIEATGLYDQVISYKTEGVKPHLKEWVKRLNPTKIAINYSRDVTIADGLTVGMRDYLAETLGKTYTRRFVSAERLVVSLIGKKLPMEVEALKTAILATKQIITEALTSDVIEAGVTTEKDLGDFMARRTKEMGMEVAFMSVVVGPTRGHSEPTDRVIQPGDLIRIDFGVRYEGYAADIQRTAYVLKPHEDKPPVEIQHLWEVALKANQACVAAIKPGVTGNDIDKVGRRILIDAGFPGYPHGAGHAIGLKVHDVGAILGPDWKERYGNTVFFPLEVNQVYAVEPILYAPDPRTGEEINIGLEEDVIVTEAGSEHIGEPQMELIVIDCGC
ncbi:MAG: M24 family metallopeptidase [bacterium]